MARHAIAQPALGAGAYLHGLLAEAGLLPQFPKQRLLHAFATANAALGELPSVRLARPAGPQYAAAIVVDDHADVGAEAMLVYLIQATAGTPGRRVLVLPLSSIAGHGVLSPRRHPRLRP